MVPGCFIGTWRKWFEDFYLSLLNLSQEIDPFVFLDLCHFWGIQIVSILLNHFFPIRSKSFFLMVIFLDFFLFLSISILTIFITNIFLEFVWLSMFLFWTMLLFDSIIMIFLFDYLFTCGLSCFFTFLTWSFWLWISLLPSLVAGTLLLLLWSTFPLLFFELFWHIFLTSFQPRLALSSNFSWKGKSCRICGKILGRNIIQM